MKTLVLIRHAKSSWDDPSLRDFDRPLNKKGHRRAKFMAAYLAASGFKPELLLSSPANRALTTAQYFQTAFQLPNLELQTNSQIYLASTEVLLSIVQSLPDALTNICMFGHNPGFTQFPNMLVEQQLDHVPTA